MGATRGAEAVAYVKERREAIAKFMASQGGRATAKQVYEAPELGNYKLKDLYNDLKRSDLLWENTTGEKGTARSNDIFVLKNKEDESMKNSEGYPDPTASVAISNTDLSKITGTSDVQPGDIWWIRRFAKSGEVLVRFLVIATFEDGGAVGFELKEYTGSEFGYSSLNCYKLVAATTDNTNLDAYVQLHRIQNVPTYILTKIDYDGYIQPEDLMAIRSIIAKEYCAASTEENEDLAKKYAEHDALVTENLTLKNSLKDSNAALQNYCEALNKASATVEKIKADLTAERDNARNETAAVCAELSKERSLVEQLLKDKSELVKQIDELRERPVNTVTNSDIAFYRDTISKLLTIVGGIYE